VKRSSRVGPVAVLAVSLLLIAAGAAAAKPRTGSVHGTVGDEEDRPLAGATVTLTTATEQKVQVTDERGEFSFLDLAPAKNVKLRAELTGYDTFEQDKIRIKAGRDTMVQVRMSSPAIQVDYAVGPPRLLAEHQDWWGSTVTQEELRRIPTARDPSALLPSTPGVQVDRVNVAGRESSMQPVYVGPGATSGDSLSSVDGLVVSDVTAMGSSPSFYDFDALEEVQISTGGADAAKATGGVTLNLVTRRGTNTWRVGARYLNAPSAAQSSSSLSRRQLALGESDLPNGFDRIRGIDDFGAEGSRSPSRRPCRAAAWCRSPSTRSGAASSQVGIVDVRQADGDGRNRGQHRLSRRAGVIAVQVDRLTDVVRQGRQGSNVPR
jgi:hypothetical protein